MSQPSPTAATHRRILVVEDEEHLAVGIKYNLRAEGYEVETAGDGPAALELVEQQHVDLVILDLMLPGMSGYSVCERLRADGHDMPILMLSARTLAEDRTRGFDVGADQYLMKPFDLDELLSRVHNLLVRHARSHQAPRSTSTLGSTYSFGQVKVDFERFQLTVRDEVVQLTHLEMKLLRYFVEREGRVVSRKDLLENVWDLPGNLNTRAPDQFIRRLRKMIEEDPAQPKHFVTIRDAGYRFVANDESEAPM